ncbi:MAG TPA: S8 family serine peptidase [Archangium sp.]|jgi:subtilisin family serine protease|uniref:S8 family serine peptidase n=1 Tax=Archangium sp. TaxID=1872627 RepID=UPI002EDBB2AF
MRFIKSTMLAAALLPAMAQAADGRFIVQFKEGHGNGRAVVESMGGQVKLEISGTRAVAAVLPERALQGLKNNPAVEFIEEDAKRYLMGQSTPYGIGMVQADQVWPTGVTGNGRKVCIIDSGLYMAHEDHAATTKSVTGYPAGWNTDKCHHGTHVAGTIAALNNTTGVVGVLPNGVDLHIIKVFGDDCAWTYASGLADAANRCVSAGANVISMSLGGGAKSRTEETAFNNANAAGVLSIAAAGNGGNSQLSYPASYPIVVSVGAVDSAKTIATFSQYNSQVDVSAPGVGVISTVGSKQVNSLTVAGATYSGGYIDGAARTAGVTGALVDGGLCDTVGAWSGKVVLCQRGVIGFVDKVNNAKAGGGIGAVIYNNVSGPFAGTLGTGVTSTIPAISLSLEDGQAIIATGGIGQSATEESSVTDPGSGYEAYDGTSMATPHVAAVAALIWSYKPTWTNLQIRTALEKTAEDRGTAGRDNYYGYGIVRAKAALDYLKATYP